MRARIVETKADRMLKRVKFLIYLPIAAFLWIFLFILVVKLAGEGGFQWATGLIEIAVKNLG